MIRITVWKAKKDETYFGFDEKRANRIRKELSKRLLGKNLKIESVGSAGWPENKDDYRIFVDLKGDVSLKDKKQVEDIKSLIQEIISRFLFDPYIEIRNVTEKEI